MSLIRKRAGRIVLVVILALLLMGSFLVMRAHADESEPVGITTTFTKNTGAWVNHTARDASLEIVQDPQEGGVLKMTIHRGNPGLRLDFPVAINAAAYPVFAVKMKINTDADNIEFESTGLAKSELCFNRVGDPGFEAVRMLYPSVTFDDDTYKTYIWNFTKTDDHYPGSKPANWSGSVTQVRFDPLWFSGDGSTGSGEVLIDYIKFYPTEAAAEAARDGEWEDDSVAGKGSESLINFQSESGLTVVGASQDSGMDAGVYTLGLGASTSLTYDWKTGLDIYTYKYVGIKLKNSSAAVQLTAAYTTKSDSVYNPAKSVNVPVTAADADFQRYLLDFSTEQNWKNVLKSFRLTFGAASGKVELDYIKFYTSRAAFDADDLWEDDVESLPDVPISMFTFTKDSQGWQAGTGCISANSGSALRVTAGLQAKPVISYVFPASLNTTHYPVFSIKMQNKTAGTQMTIRFSDTETIADGEALTVSITADDTPYQIYRINAELLSGWKTKHVKSMQIELADAGGNYVQVDYIRFYRSLTEMSEDGPFEDDRAERPYATAAFTFGLLNSGWENGSSGSASITNPSGSELVMDVSGELPYIAFQYKSGDANDWQVGLDAYTYRYLAIRMRTETASDYGEFKFRRNISGDGMFTDARTVPFELEPGSGYHMYVLDLGKNHYWTGSISAFQFYPVGDGAAGDRVYLDDMCFYESLDDIDPEYDPDPPDGFEGKTVFDFTGGSTERFQNARSTHATMTAGEEGLEISIRNDDPVLVYEFYQDGRGLNADTYKVVKITMLNDTASELCEFFFESYYNNMLYSWGATQNALTQTISPFDETYKEYVIDLSGYLNWQGEITMMRFDPAWFDGGEGTGKVTIKRIEFFEDLEAAVGGDASDTPETGLTYGIRAGLVIAGGVMLGAALVIAGAALVVFLNGKGRQTS